MLELLKNYYIGGVDINLEENITSNYVSAYQTKNGVLYLHTLNYDGKIHYNFIYDITKNDLLDGSKLDKEGFLFYIGITENEFLVELDDLNINNICSLAHSLQQYNGSIFNEYYDKVDSIDDLYTELLYIIEG